MARRRLRQRAYWRIARDVAYDISLALVFVTLFLTFVAQAFRVEGPSMMPLLQNGERIIVYKLCYRLGPIKRGDVVVFWAPLEPSQSYIKRIVGLPGDRIEAHRGDLLINGHATREPYLAARFRDEGDFGPIIVRAGHYYVMGDHRNGSSDSRVWGDVPARYIYGRAVLRFWPLNRIGRIE